MTGLPKPPRISPLALAFQGDLERLIAEPATRLVRIWPALGLGLLLSLTATAAVMPVDVVVTAQGRIAADAPPMLLRPNARAVLLELLVKPGDVVTKGQRLARLDATAPQADQAALLAEKTSLLAEIARHRADLSGADMVVNSAQTAQQAEILAQRRSAAQARAAALDAAISALQNEERRQAARLPALRERLDIARQLEATRQDMVDRKIAPQTEALLARSARLALEAELSGLLAQTADLSRQLRSAQDARAVFDADRLREPTEALPRLHLRLSQIEDALSKANRVAALTEIVAPGPGVVVSVAPGGVGAVVAEGDPLVVLIPTDAGMVADISISSADLGRVAVGDLVTLKIDAFPYRRFGAAQGRIASLGPLSQTPEGGNEALHPARVTLLGGPGELPAGLTIAPGMTLSAEVKTGTRTVLDYFLDPIERGISESLREP